MSHKISLSLPKGWSIETSNEKDDQGIEVACFFASDPANEAASIELYYGETPEGSDAKIECMNNYLEVIGSDTDEEEIPVEKSGFMGVEAWYYEAEDDMGDPIKVICCEPSKGMMLLGIFCNDSDESLEALMEQVSKGIKLV